DDDERFRHEPPSRCHVCQLLARGRTNRAPGRTVRRPSSSRWTRAAERRAASNPVAERSASASFGSSTPGGARRAAAPGGGGGRVRVLRLGAVERRVKRRGVGGEMGRHRGAPPRRNAPRKKPSLL